MTKSMDSIELSLFSNRINSVCEEMGAVLRCSAFSPNIKDRLDFSCAIFNRSGDLSAQAAHIPVHLGSMAYAMHSIVSKFEWCSGDMLILNDPFLGGTHLPDVTLIAPFFIENQLVGFVANRAHHADIGSESPGSMPLSQTLADEGVIIKPQFLMKKGQVDKAFYADLLACMITPNDSQGDFNAQISANLKGVERISELVKSLGLKMYQQGLQDLNSYAANLAQTALSGIPDGEYTFEDFMDDDGFGTENVKIKVIIIKKAKLLITDFTGSDAQTQGNINCPLSVCAASVYYVFRCLMPAATPAVAGSFKDIKIIAPLGCLLNAKAPAAVAAGNVETSSRIVDVLLGALAQAIPKDIPAASHGSMNNIAMGTYNSQSANNIQPGIQSGNWSYYETIGGGMGASRLSDGQSAVQTHMTNTLNTPVEILETKYPLRITRYAIRKGSGGAGLHQGGDGLIRQFEFLAPTDVTLLTERRRYNPWGLNHGKPGKRGVNQLNDQVIPAKVSLSLQAGDRLTIKTAGGGGYGHYEK